MTEEQRTEIVAAMIEKLKSLPDETEMATSWLFGELFSEMETDLNELSMIHNAVFRAAKKNRLFLDMSKHEGLVEGLPCNLDYVVHHLERKKPRNRYEIIDGMKVKVYVD